MQLLLLPVWGALLAGSVALYINEESAPLVGQPIAFLTDRIGLVEFRGPDFSVWSNASANQGFIRGTTVATAAGATARILIGSELVLNVSENSQVVIGDSTEIKSDRELHVSVLRGELKLDAGENNSNKQVNASATSPLLSNLAKPDSVVIETGSVSARVNLDSETKLSVLKEFGKPAILSALKGGAIVHDSAEGTKRVIGDVPKPSGLLSFVLPVMNRSEVSLEPPPLVKPTLVPEAIVDPKDYVAGFVPDPEMQSRHVYTFSRSLIPGRLTIRFEHPLDPFWRGSQEPPAIRLAANGRVSKNPFSKDTTAGVTRIEQYFGIPKEETAELRKSGQVSIQLLPAVDDSISGKRHLASQDSSSSLLVSSLRHSRFERLLVTLHGPKVDMRPESSLPNDFEERELAVVGSKSLAIYQHQKGGLPFVHRLVAASEGFRIELDPESFAGFPRTPAAGQNLVHVVRMGKPIMSLVSKDQAILKQFVTQAIRLTRADFAFDGTFEEIIQWSNLGAKEWESVSKKPQVLSYCRMNGDGRLVTLSGSLLRRYPKIKNTLSPSCPHAFLVSNRLTLFETRPGY